MDTGACTGARSSAYAAGLDTMLSKVVTSDVTKLLAKPEDPLPGALRVHSS